MWPRLIPPPAMTMLKTRGQWSRPPPAFTFGVRPNSLVMSTSVESSKPRLLQVQDQSGKGLVEIGKLRRCRDSDMSECPTRHRSR